MSVGRTVPRMAGHVRATLGTILGVAAVTAGVLTACSSSPGVVTTGPLGSSDAAGSSHVCLPVANARAVATFPVASFSVPGTVTIASVSLTRARNLTLTDAVLVDHGGEATGFFADYPPTSAELAASPGLDWAHRRPAVGTTLNRSKPGRQWDLVLALKPGASDGSFAYATVRYRAGQHRYELRTATGGHVLISPRSCPQR